MVVQSGREFLPCRFESLSDRGKGDHSWSTFELPDVGHMAMLDAPDRVTELILQGS
jgi:hypothetical protein